jgi:hypothetical protein
VSRNPKWARGRDELGKSCDPLGLELPTGPDEVAAAAGEPEINAWVVIRPVRLWCKSTAEGSAANDERAAVHSHNLIHSVLPNHALLAA